MIYVAAGLVVAPLVAMASGRVDPLLALLVALILAEIPGIAPADQLASGLSNAGVITVAAMLVIAKGVVQTGVVSRATWALLASTSTAQQVLRRLSFPIGVASALINTTPLVALLIPAARQLDQTKRIPAREVLLPLAHITTLAGSVTLIGTSSNLVIAGSRASTGWTWGCCRLRPWRCRSRWSPPSSSTSRVRVLCEAPWTRQPAAKTGALRSR